MRDSFLVIKRPSPSGKALSRTQAGQSLIELAILLPVLLLLCIGVIEIGRYAYISILIGNAARAGAAYGAQSLTRSADSSGISTASNNDFLNNGQTGLTVNSIPTCGCDSGGTVTGAQCNGTLTAGTCSAGAHWVVMVNVTSSGTFNPLFSYPGIPSPLTISKTATLRVAQE